MAKYVGKIFKVENSKLGIRRNGTHYVHVKWFNPFTRKFWCRIITSLETKNTKEEFSRLRTGGKYMPFSKASDDEFLVFTNSKYSRLRDGKICPIPVGKAVGFEVWNGYEGGRNLHISSLKGKREKTKKILK